jgi:hypothetical protein
MANGTLTVTGDNSTLIALSGRPREVIVVFKHDHEPPPCDPHHHKDKLEWKVTFEDEDPHVHHHLGHHHHDRLWFLFIEWKVSGVREIEWIVLY